VEVEGLRKHFPIHKGLFGRHVGDVKAVDDVSFVVYPKETLGLVGESGCGKTTVGRTLLRLLEPTAGSASFDGVDLFGLGRAELRAMRRQMQIIFQDPYSSLNPRMTVGSIIGDALELHGMAKGDERFDRARDLLERVGLQGSYVDRYPHEFSGGQRQRIGIARAVALRPRFIVCDEAVSALDVSVQAQILNLMKELQEELELSYLFIAHDLSVVRHIADRVAVMYLGRIVETSVCGDLYEAPLHPYTQALLSAIPQPDPSRKTERVILEGDVPNPISPPPGCHFHTRCPLAFDRCGSEVPVMRSVRDGHQVRCHLYEDVPYPAEPIPIGGERPHESTPAPAEESDEVGDWDGSLEFDIFDGIDEEDQKPVGIPEVLRDRAGMELGPFGEIVDPEDTFLRTAEIPSLDAIVAGDAPSVADVRAPRLTDPGQPIDGDEDEEAATQVDMAPLEEELTDPEITPEDLGADLDDSTTADLEPVSELGIDTLDPPEEAEPGPTDIAPRDPSASLAAVEAEAAPDPALVDTVEAPSPVEPDAEPTEPDRAPPTPASRDDETPGTEEPTIQAGPPPEEPTIPAGPPPEEPTIQAGPPPEEPTIPAGPPPKVPAEETGAIPPIHDEDGVPDDVSLHGDAFAPLELALGGEEDEDDDQTLDLPTIFPEPTGEEPPPVIVDDDEED